MRNGVISREPVNEWDAAQQEDASRSARQRSSRESRQDGSKNGKKVAEVTFFLGEDLTLKGRRFRVSNIIGEKAVVLEAIGEIVLKEGIGGRNRTRANVVGRRYNAG